MSLATDLSVASWVAYWRCLQRYHGYTVRGLEHLDGAGAKLVVGYHGRPLAYDMCMLTVALYDRYGYLPHGIVHRSVELLSPVKQFTEALGFVPGDGRAMRAAIRRGEHVVVTPGGGHEAFRSFERRYQVDWGDHLGYVRLAQKHRLPIVPVAASGTDDAYVGLFDADAVRTAFGISLDRSWLTWLGLGPLGPYPFSPPFPVRIRQVIGEPIDPWTDAPATLKADDDAVVRSVDKRVRAAVQKLLDDAAA